MKKIQMNTNLLPIFSGTYESPFWEVRETNNNGDELQVEYDFKEFMQSIVDVYKDNGKYILDELQQYAPFIKSIEFTGDFYSPREYNFSTDTLDFVLTINYKQLLETVNNLRDDEKFQRFLHDKYTSCDGFISFTPNNYIDLREQIVKQNDEFEQSIGALLQYLCIDEDRPQSIEESLADQWQGNGYGGLDYKIVCWDHDCELVYADDYYCPKENCTVNPRVQI